MLLGIVICPLSLQTTSTSSWSTNSMLGDVPRYHTYVFVVVVKIQVSVSASLLWHRGQGVLLSPLNWIRLLYTESEKLTRQYNERRASESTTYLQTPVLFQMLSVSLLGGSFQAHATLQYIVWVYSLRKCSLPAASQPQILVA